MLCFILLGTGFIMPAGSHHATPSTTNGPYYSFDSDGPFVLDRSYILRDDNPASTNTGDNDDAGWKRDAGNDIAHATVIYVGELIDNTSGRGRSGKLSPTDLADCYSIRIAKGQQIHITMTPPSSFNFDAGLYDASGNLLQNSTLPGSATEDLLYTAPQVSKIYVIFRFINGTGQGQYHFSANMLTQNDANSNGDVSNIRSGAWPITPGTINGWLDMNDSYDWYKFQVTSGQYINLSLTMKTLAYLTDFDASLYNTTGALVYYSRAYLDDAFDYQANETGYWYARIDIFPGWVDCPHPTEWKYYSYGSGPYNLTLTLKSSGTPPYSSIPEPQITPIAKTFIIPNNASGSSDEYGYFASIPACNYISGGMRYVAPIVYSGDQTPTAYYDDTTSFGVVDDTTQYLVNDWNAYLALYGKNATQYTVLSDPIQAAADIAIHGWNSSQTAVVAVDGSGYKDTTRTVLKKTKTLTRNVDVKVIENDDPVLKSGFGYMAFIGPKWGAIAVNCSGIITTNGNDAGAMLTQVFPKYISIASDDWPVPYDGHGDASDIYMPITRAGFWSALSGLNTALYDKLTVTKFEGDRYHVKVSPNDAVLTATVTTDTAADLMVFLVDPQGNLRQPIPPAWNGPVNPVHVWNGLENPAVNPWRCWNPAPHTQFSAQVLHPEKGRWTVIVVPRNPTGANVKYTLTTTVRTINADRADAAISAANAAVIASLNHYPLLYVTKNSVPAATASAFTTLGVTKVIFVERNNIGAGVRGSLPIDKDLKIMKDIVDEIKGNTATSENYIVVTSLKTGDGYAAPAAMLAAYHGAPVIRVEDCPDGDPAAIAERIEAWQRWDGDYYHGSRANGHMPEASAPVDQNRLKLMFTFLKFLLNKTNFSSLPPLGMDAKRYWNEEMFNETHGYITSLGLDRTGKEAYAVVAPRNDINMELHSLLMGNNSYAGDIPGITPAYSSDIVVRDILYPALIYANPGRNTTTTTLMNFPDGTSFTLNDHHSYPAYSSRVVKNTFASHLRTYEGHSFWAPFIALMNNGASVYYYSGHGTGGSGMSSMYPQTNYSTYPDQVWWDGWRGYMYDAWKTPRDGGWTWFNPEPPELYDLIHYKWVDQYFDNLHSNVVFYMSCTTGDGDGPLVFMDHGAAIWYGNGNTGLCPEADIGDDEVFKLTLLHGVSIGEAFADQVWLHYRDFTTGDPTSMYGPASMTVSSIQVIYGDPSLVVYSPEWSSPVPIDA